MKEFFVALDEAVHEYNTVYKPILTKRRQQIKELRAKEKQKQLAKLKADLKKTKLNKTKGLKVVVE